MCRSTKVNGACQSRSLTLRADEAEAQSIFIMESAALGSSDANGSSCRIVMPGHTALSQGYDWQERAGGRKAACDRSTAAEAAM